MQTGESVADRTKAETLVLTGTANLESLDRVHREACRLARAGCDVVVDWTAANYVDTCVLQELVALGTAVRGAGKQLLVTENETVARYLAISGLSPYFPRLPSDGIPSRARIGSEERNA